MMVLIRSQQSQSTVPLGWEGVENRESQETCQQLLNKLLLPGKEVNDGSGFF